MPRRRLCLLRLEADLKAAGQQGCAEKFGYSNAAGSRGRG
jgi:hypothetical protein